MISPDTRYPCPGKYEGERYMVPLLYQRYFPDEQFGDVTEFGAWFGQYDTGRRGIVYLCENSDGFVSELDETTFNRERDRCDAFYSEDPFDSEEVEN